MRIPDQVGHRTGADGRLGLRLEVIPAHALEDSQAFPRDLQKLLQDPGAGPGSAPVNQDLVPLGDIVFHVGQALGSVVRSGPPQKT